MSDLHAAGGAVTLAFVAMLALVALAVGVADRGHEWLDRVVAAVVGILALQVALGAATWLAGARPREDLHLLYGVALLGVLPLAGSFASDAPPRARAAVLGGAAIVGLFLGWRLYGTG